MRVGRRRETNLTLPPGVRRIGARYFWQPTSKRERDERRAKGLPMSVALGPVMDASARKLWAQLSGYRDDVPATDGTVAELLHLFETYDLERGRKPKTISEYRRSLTVLRARFGAARYGKTAAEAMAGRAIGKVDVQRFVREVGNVQANRHVAVLSAVFTYAAREGKTDYNPCLGVERNPEAPREREVEPWEAEVLLAVATPLMALLMRYERLTGWREGDVRILGRPQLTAQGIRLKQGKRGRRQLWLWTPELREIISEAIARPEARRGMAVFASRTGGPLTVSGFQSMWQRTRARANRLLARCEVPLKIEDLHFHDLRAAAGDDAAEMGQDRAEFLGNSKAVAERHYARREQKVRPLR
jgi:integrase